MRLWGLRELPARSTGTRRQAALRSGFGTPGKARPLKQFTISRTAMNWSRVEAGGSGEQSGLPLVNTHYSEGAGRYNHNGCRNGQDAGQEEAVGKM